MEVDDLAFKDMFKKIGIFGHAWQAKCKNQFLTLPFVAKSFAAGNNHIALLSTSSQLHCIGQNNKGQCGSRKDTTESFETVTFDELDDANNDKLFNNTRFSQVACGADFTIALEEGRRLLFVTGYNDCGQVGFFKIKN